MKNSLRSAFTLVELLVVMAIIGLLVSLLIPTMQTTMDKAKSITCMGNLRQIGLAVNLYVVDHDGTYPFVESDPSDPVYPSQETEAKPIKDALTPYGITPQVLRCPMDQGGASSYFQTKGSSYQWVPILDGETKVNPRIYTPRGAFTVSPSMIRICMDYEPVHFNRCNRLYGDGHVVAQLVDPAP